MFLLAITLMVSTRECLCNCWDRSRQRTGHERNCPALAQQRLLTYEITDYYRHWTQPCRLYLLNVIPWFVKDPLSQINFKSIASVAKGSGVEFTKPLLPPQFMCFLHGVFPLNPQPGFMKQSSPLEHRVNLDVLSPNAQLWALHLVTGREEVSRFPFTFLLDLGGNKTPSKKQLLPLP